MVFDNCKRAISTISEQELKDLIGNQEENLWIEFKRQEYRRDPNDNEKHKREICKDVTAMANAEGGYIFIGIQEEDGIAQGFFSVDKFEEIENDVRNVCRQSIEPAIQHLEVKTRTFEWNGKDVTLVIIHIPPSDFRPHGFRWKGSINFVRRIGDHTTEFPMSELGEAFSVRHYPLIIGQLDGKLDTILRYMSRNRRSLMSPEDDALDQDDVDSLLRLMQLRFKNAISGEPYYRIFAVPMTELLKPDAIPTDDELVRHILKDPPNVRKTGFGFIGVKRIEPLEEGIKGVDVWGYEVLLLKNGFLELRTPLSSTQFQWYKQERQIPDDSHWLYPYGLCEYPVTFLRLVKEIYSAAGVDSQIHVQQEYHNLHGFILVGGHPRNPGFGLFEHHHRRYQSTGAIVSKQTISLDFVPDHVAYDFIKEVYAAFELGPEAIPLFDANRYFSP